MGVSVVIPTLNANDTLGAQLEALAGQTFDGEVEVLVIDNGSKVNPSVVTREFEDRLNVRVLDGNAHRGASHARNVGIRAARGEIVAFCDADDVVQPGWLAALVAAARDADLVCGALVTQCEINDGQDRAHRGDQLTQPLYFGQPFMWTCNGAGWRSTLLSGGGFDLALGPGEDVDLSWRVLDAGGRIVFTEDAVVHYRVRSSPRRLFRQWYTYGLAEAMLFSRYRGRLMQRRSWREVGRYVAFLLLRWPWALPPGGRRNTWLMWAGGEAGRLAGSWRARVVFL